MLIKEHTGSIPELIDINITSDLILLRNNKSDRYNVLLDLITYSIFADNKDIDTIHHVNSNQQLHPQ